MGAKSRRKGFGYENEIAAKFRAIGFKNAKRHLEFQACEANGYDLDNTGALRIQCKRYKAYAPISKIEEVRCSSDKLPLLVTRGDRQRDVVAMYLDDFLAMVQDIGIVWEGEGNVEG